MKQTVNIPLYIRKVKLSNARRIKYYEEGCNAPKAMKYQDRSKYEYLKQGAKKLLTNKATGEVVIANPLAAGTASWTTINGQYFYNGTIREHTRAKVVKTIKEFLGPYFNTLSPVALCEYPIRISLNIFDTITEGGSDWDLDNRATPYLKCSQDLLSGNRGLSKKIIIDDNVRFITSIHLNYKEVLTSDERMLVLTIESV